MSRSTPPASDPVAADSHYRPRVFARPSEEFDELRRTAQVHDTFQQQLDGLLKARHARQRLGAEELEQKRAEYLAGHPADAAGVWVYYPWRHALVHLLAEPDFVELRTVRNRHKISRDEQRVLSERRVGVIGLSVGAQVAIVLAMERICGELRLADFDVLELSNLNRLREGVFGLGLSKAVLAARAIAEIDPFLRVRCYSQGVTPETLDAFLMDGGALDVLVDECDDVAVKLRCRERARARRIPVVMEANDRATLDIERFDREPERPIMHGWLRDLDLSRIDQLKTSEEKVPYLLPMVGVATMSDKLRASLLEVGESLETWPQLASDVSLGAGVVAHVVRRILLDQLTGSGRYFVDLEEIIADQASDRKLDAEPAPDTSSVEASPEELEAIEQLGGVGEPGQVPLAPDVVARLVEAALRAPSGANEQPWCWHVSGPNLWLLGRPRFGDAQLLNHRQRATHVALGTATENLVLAAHHEGLSVKLDLVHTEASVAVGFRCFPASHASDAHEPPTFDALYAQIAERQTNRRRGHRAPLPSATKDALESAASSVAGCRMKLLDAPEAVAQVADVAARAERIRLLHPQGHRDLLKEVRWTPAEAELTRDGVDLRTFELSPSERVGLGMLRFPRVPALLKHWGEGKGLEKLTRGAIAAASAVGLISVQNRGFWDWFHGGRAVERSWLSAAELGVALQPHTAAPYLCQRARGGGARDFDTATLDELAEIHARLCLLFEVDENDHQVFLFRLFQASEPPARSLRRPASMSGA